MLQAKCAIHKDEIIGITDPRLFGSFVEHLGRAIYTGIYEPGHPTADDQGFRMDVLELVKELQVPLIRYPGGNFVSGYNWQDGIGPVKDRPTRLDLAWKSREPNKVGIDEFIDWCQKANAGIMQAVNLGTGTPVEAGYLVEYCNHPAGTYWSDLRRIYGHEQPHNIKVWCLGNEMDGPWQIGQLTAEEYGKKALETAKIMRLADPDIQLVACGSSGPGMPTFPEWDRIVLDSLYEQVDFISLHRYYNLEEAGSIKDFLTSFANLDRFIATISATTDFVQAKKRSQKRVYLSLDEWNVWNHPFPEYKTWDFAKPRLEETYNLLDALVFAGLLCSILNHADRIKIACLAQLVNVIAPIMTQPGGAVVRQTIYYPFQQVSKFGRGQVLHPHLACPLHESIYGDVPILETAVILNPARKELTIFILNCDQQEAAEMELDLRDFVKLTPLEHQILHGADLTAFNNFENPERVKPQSLPVSGGDCHRFSVVIPKLSWNMLRYSYNL